MDNLIERLPTASESDIAQLGYPNGETVTKKMYWTGSSYVPVKRRMFTYDLNQQFTAGQSFVIANNFPLLPSQIINISGVFVCVINGGYFISTMETYVVEASKTLNGIQRISTFNARAYIRVFVDYI